MSETRNYQEEFDAELYEVVRTVDAWIGDDSFRIEIQKSLHNGWSTQPFSFRCWKMRTLPDSKKFEILLGCSTYPSEPWQVLVQEFTLFGNNRFPTEDDALATALGELHGRIEMQKSAAAPPNKNG
jgi:hypothetical protein